MVARQAGTTRCTRLHSTSRLFCGRWESRNNSLCPYSAHKNSPTKSKRQRTFAILFSEARYPSGKGEVCKTFMRGFDSHPRLQQSPCMDFQAAYSTTFLRVPIGSIEISISSP